MAVVNKVENGGGGGGGGGGLFFFWFFILGSWGVVDFPFFVSDVRVSEYG